MTFKVRQIVKDAMKVDEFSYRVTDVWTDGKNLLVGDDKEVDEKFDDQQLIVEMEDIFHIAKENLEEYLDWHGRVTFGFEEDAKFCKKNISQTKKFLKKYSA